MWAKEKKCKYSNQKEKFGYEWILRNDKRIKRLLISKITKKQTKNNLKIINNNKIKNVNKKSIKLNKIVKNI